MKILVTGTTGGVGGAVRDAARCAGWEVHEFNRADFAGLDDAAVSIPQGLDAVVFATGACEVRPLSMLSDDALAEMLRVNCGLFVKLMRAIVSARRYAESGMQAIAVSSVSAIEGWAGGVAYCASKGALSAAARAMNAELRAKNISVRSLEPRYIRTKMFAAGAGRMGVSEAQAVPPADFARNIIEMLSGKER